jgi:tRNA pseudouridine38-40 synthase
VSQPVRQICALVTYDGTGYNGFQIQAGVPTIQGSLEDALQQVVGQFCRVVGSGRTDTGVHALGQVIWAEVPWSHSLEALGRAWNHFLPEAILVRKIVEAPAGFHPRFSATSRTYRYTVYHPTGSVQSNWLRFPMLDRYALIERQRLDVEAMNEAAQPLLGEHDFVTFGQPPQGEVTIRRIAAIGWQRSGEDLLDLAAIPLEPLIFTVCANAFLRRMVRNLVGTLLAVGRGEWRSQDVAEALAACDRSRSAAPAPPNGLVLERVEYAAYPELFADRLPVV